MMRTTALCVVCLGVIAEAAQDTVALTQQAESLAAGGKYDEAEQLWKQALELTPQNFPALFDLGYLYFKRQKFQLAAPVLRLAVQVRPNDFNALYLLGASRSRMGDVDDALRSWQDALRIQPGNVRLMQIMAVEYSKGRYFGEASKLTQHVLTLKPDDPNNYFLAIKTAQDAGNLETAAAIAERASIKFPDSARANLEYAFHLQLKGQIAKALEYLERAMKEDPSYEEPFFFYGNLLVDQGRDKEAVSYLRNAIKDRNDYVPARVVLARALMNQHLWDEAISELNETAALDPRHPQPHLLLSQIFFRLGNESRAMEEKQISLRLRRENPTVLEAVQSRPFPSN
jgi:tetratricopeptide (TPR) repeat protein